MYLINDDVMVTIMNHLIDAGNHVPTSSQASTSLESACKLIISNQVVHVNVHVPQDSLDDIKKQVEARLNNA